MVENDRLLEGWIVLKLFSRAPLFVAHEPGKAFERIVGSSLRGNFVTGSSLRGNFDSSLKIFLRRGFFSLPFQSFPRF